MKKFPLILFVLIGMLALCFSSCKDKSEENTLWNNYREWREKNDAWLVEQQARKNPDGTPYFQTIVPKWNPGAYVLIHYFNDRAQTADNLSPMLTSTIDCRYIGRYCTDQAFDSSYNQTKYGPGIFRTQLTSVISGWAIAFEEMHVGDTAEIVIPYQQAYGATTNSAIPPYSNLRFNVKLVDIATYEVNPK